MRFHHSAHPGRSVRLAYCMNLHPGETLEEVREGIRSITVPLRDRLAGGGLFGVGVYLPAAVAEPLAAQGGRGDLERFSAFLLGEGLDPFTFNAFPHGGFHGLGLKAGVYAPDWRDPGRVAFTRAVAAVAEHLWRAASPEGRAGHVSISTHPGSFGAWVEGPRDLDLCGEGMGEVVEQLVGIEARGGPRIVLSLEAEPRASANDTTELAAFLVVARTRAARRLVEGSGTDEGAARELAARHLGACLDGCHAAVEFEQPEQAWRRANLGGTLGKVQFSSALSVADPRDAAAREALLGMDEPRYLHQVTGRGAGGGGWARVTDLPELADALESGAGTWLECEEWRCHFHVPVDLEAVGGLGTTRSHADALLAAALEDTSGWSTDELHVEIETYTWDVLPGAARGVGALVDGLEREYGHVLGLLQAAGWERA